MNKITIIGTGSVGSTIAYTLTATNIASEIVMIDVNDKKAMGEALDIRQGTPFCAPCSIYAGSYVDAKDSDIVIITSGVARKPGQTRLDLAQINVDILKSIIPQITKYAPDATYVIVSNPVDILTYTFCKCSGIPEERIIGSGTILDTARLRSRLAEYFTISQHNVHAYVLGEHGDTSVIPWSTANISNVPVLDYSKSFIRPEGLIVPDLSVEEVENYVRKSGARVIERKGATFYAVSMSVCHICKCLLSGIDTTMTVSTMLHGEYGIDDVCLSLLTVVGRKGAHSKVMIPLTDSEIKDLQNSAESLKNIIRQTNI
ncbi:MAG: L-lactate dehydrogenase [Clostridia bacterium]|nr:L-lactate dehydrogenase [Clostridia bacterium]MBQ1995919.1 L-lactate dehydrogenase [Clostridia bacterium]